MHIILTVVFTVLCVAATFYVLENRRQNGRAIKHGCRPPRVYPHKDPVLGIDLFLATGKAIQEHRYLELTRRYSTLGDTFSAKSLGSSSIHSIEPMNIQAVFSVNSADWGVEPIRLPAQNAFCGRGFITTDGPAWEHSRSLLRPSFSKGTAIDLSTLETFLKQLIDRIPKDGSTFDLQPMLFSLYLDTATLFLFGESIDALSGNTFTEAEAFLKAFDHSMLGSGVQIALGPFKFLYQFMDPKWRESCRTTHLFADNYVQRALEHRRRSGSNDKEGTPSRKPYFLLSGMAEQTEDRVKLRNEILQAMMAAQETTAALISNISFLLSRNQPVCQRLREEISTLSKTDLSQEILQNMEYLSNIVKETLRLYPVFPQMNRVALVDTLLPTGGGPKGADPIYCPAGTGFDTSWYNLHRLESIWELPDRWETFKPDHWQYLPFGGGPRSCLGRTKALVEASYVIVRLMQEFGRIESRDDREWTGQVQLTAKNANGCKIAVFPA